MSAIFKNKHSTTDERVGPDCPTGQNVTVFISLEKKRQPQKRRLLKDIHLIFIRKILQLEDNLKIMYLKSFILQIKENLEMCKNFPSIVVQLAVRGTPQNRGVWSLSSAFID